MKSASDIFIEQQEREALQELNELRNDVDRIEYIRDSLVTGNNKSIKPSCVTPLCVQNNIEQK